METIHRSGRNQYKAGLKNNPVMGVYDWQRLRKAKALRRKRPAKNRKPTIPQESELLRVRAFLEETARTPYVASRDTLMCDFMRVYLLRIGEVCTLNLAAFDFEKGTFIVDPVFEKTSKEKHYSLRGAPAWFRRRLVEFLSEYGDRFVSGFLFVSAGASKKPQPWIKPDTWIGSRWTRAVKAAGLYKVRFVDAAGHRVGSIRTHHWRILGITKLLQQGYSPKEVQAFTQHDCIETIMNYYWLLEEEKAREHIMFDSIAGLIE